LSVEEFRQDAKRFDRILYHFGNSDFHTHMFDLLESHPGVVVLHDLYLSGVQAWREHHHRQHRHFSRSLAMDHGYGALVEHLEGEPDGAIWTYPVNRQVLQAAMGVIVHSQFNFQRIAGVDVDPSAVACIPLLHAVAHPDREAARLCLGLDRDRPLLCTFGGIGKNKHSLLLLRGYADFLRSRDFGGKLVFVGSAAGGAFGEAFEALVEELGIADRIEITGYADPGLYRDYLAAADVAIQLRALTRGETSAAAFDCLAHGIPTVVNAHGPMAEIDDGAVLKLSDDPTAEEVADAFRSLFDSPSLRSEMSRHAVRLVRDHHAPHAIGERYRDAIEAFSTGGSGALREAVLIEAVRDRAYGTASEADLAEFSGCLDLCLSPPPRRTLFIDVSELVHRDWQSGIQRVVKAILSELLRNPPAGFRIEPVFGSIEGDKAIYRAARAFMARFLGQADDDWTNEVVEPANGDVFVGLDLAPTLVPRLCDDGLYTTWRARGVALHFVAYDLLPVLRPEFFIAGAAEDFARWIEAIARVADGVVCISQAVATELRDYLSRTATGRESLRIGHFHLGNDTIMPKVTSGESVPRGASRADRVGGPFVLMVGTLEPRKGHAQAIDAFERLWDEGETTRLVIVARKGWLVDDLVSRITGHRWFGKRLFWFSDIEDAELEELYRGARGLVAASYAEGFGLPLIEAAKRDLPILARDLLVFREVAGAHVTYFERSGAHLSAEIGDWLRALAAGDAVAPTGMPILTWAQSTAQLIEAVLGADGPDARPPVPATAGTVP
jgi:glycosyltransferase involved in cell wall biosynthesis